MSAEQHDRELEPSDDTVAALQHAVAKARGGTLGHEAFNPKQGRLSAASYLGAHTSYGPPYRPSASEWLEVARIAIQAYELERAREEGRG